MANRTARREPRKQRDELAPMDLEARRKKLGLPPDINRRALAIKVLRLANPRDRDRLEEHESLFIARLLDPVLVAKITGKSARPGRRKSTAVALRADEIAETYFADRAIFPNAKHKEETAPRVASFYGVSTSYVDKVLHALPAKRRAELKRQAKALAKSYAEWQATPRGMAVMAKHQELLRALARERKSSQPLTTRN